MFLYLLFGIIYIFTHATVAQDATSNFTQIIAFGDSYTTDKNDVCNGPKWIRQLPWTNLSIENYAVGGAYCAYTGNTSSSSVTEQVKEFLGSNTTHVSSDTLYSIMIGINDMVGNKDVESVLRCIQDQVNELHQEVGAKHFLVFNMVPFDKSPSVAQDGTAAKSSAWIGTFNDQIRPAVSTLYQSGVAIELVDIHSTVSHVYEHQADYGITRDPRTYYTLTNDPDSDTNELENGNTYFWYNYAHLTSVVHKQIANTVDAQYRRKSSPSEPTSTAGDRPWPTIAPDTLYLALAVSVLILY